MEKYNNLHFFVVDLKSAINKISSNFDMFADNKSSRKNLQSLKVSFSLLISYIYQVMEINNLISSLNSMEQLNLKGLKDNKPAQKFNKKRRDLITTLYSEHEKLVEIFLNQFKICYNQINSTFSKIEDKSGKDRVYDSASDFRQLYYNSNSLKHIIESAKTLSEHLKSSDHADHNQKEETINSISQFNQEKLDELEKYLNGVTVSLAMSSDVKLSSSIRQEVLQIKKVLPPKTIVASKEVLEKLKYSSQLLLDFEQIEIVLQGSQGLSGGNIQRLNTKLDDLRRTLQLAIEVERKNQEKLNNEKKTTEAKVEYASNAVRTYSDILDGNRQLEQEQIRIQNNNHEMQIENKKLTQELNQEYSNAEKAIKRGDSAQASELYNSALKKLETTSQNKQTIQHKLNATVVTLLPPEYVDMKKRLEQISMLHNLSLSKNTEFNNGGISK